MHQKWPPRNALWGEHPPECPSELGPRFGPRSSCGASSQYRYLAIRNDMKCSGPPPPQRDSLSSNVMLDQNLTDVDVNDGDLRNAWMIVS